MHGVINLLKPPGMTSHDAVGFVRRVCGLRRVGHTGTLDPAAAGVLPICLGHATRLALNLQAGRKGYVAEFTFGHETDTLDAVGQIVHTGPVDGVSEAALRRALDAWQGDVLQTPPVFSAIKQGGKKLYELARAGASEADVAPAARQVTIHRLTIQRFMPGPAPRALIAIECGSGTYIRSLARDVGRALGSYATMTFLVRERSGDFTIDAAYTVEQLQHDAASALIPLIDILRRCAELTVTDDDAARRLWHGQHITGSGWPATVLVMATDASLAALAAPVEAGHNVYRAVKVFNLNESAE